MFGKVGITGNFDELQNIEDRAPFQQSWSSKLFNVTNNRFRIRPMPNLKFWKWSFSKGIWIFSAGQQSIGLCINVRDVSSLTFAVCGSLVSV